jgi:hypothetical protein
MIGKAFVTRKRFLGVPKVLCAGWVGTIKHIVQWLKGQKEQKRGSHAVAGWVQL